jgi:hypothetical protein
MKQAVIIIYVPPRLEQSEKDFLDENLKKVNTNHEGFEVFYIEDPTRSKAEVEVFFNSYYKL